MDLRRADKKFLAREDGAAEMEVVRTRGAIVTDARGRKYIDFLAGWCVGNFGWGNEAMTAKIRRPRADYVYPEYLYRPWVELAQLLAEMTPGKLQKSFRATGGSEAVDIALQIAMAGTGRKKFLSIEGSYHGNAVGGVSVASSSGREPFPNLLSNCAKIKPPLNARKAETVERMLKRRDVAALIVEPIVLNLGVLIPDQEFMTAVARACKRYGTLLIADEVATGFGRTGRMFASEHFDLEPDIMCVAKAMSGGYAPIGTAITTAAVADSIQGKTGFYSTYGWHPSSVEVSLAVLRWLRKNERTLLGGVIRMSDYMRRRISEMPFRDEPKLHIRGFAIGVATGDEKYANSIAEQCRRKGLLLTTADDSLTMFPPLTLEQKVAEQAMDILESCLR